MHPIAPARTPSIIVKTRAAGWRLLTVIGTLPMTWTTLPQAAHADEAEKVNVTFVNPDRFVDAIDGRNDPQPALRLIRQHLQTLGRRVLATDQRLDIQVLDVDLSGHIDYRPQPIWVRIVRPEFDWPRITLQYRLSGPAGAVRQGEAVVSDSSYGSRPGRVLDTGSLPAERRMLTQWFERTFGSQGREAIEP